MKKGESWGRGEHANMPKEVRMEKYPSGHVGRGKDIDDTMTRIDDENRQMEGKRNKYLSEQH